ncbi:intein-containing Rv2578c family radical SAM protein [Gryllotalpicola reticulitermitis]|uniref:Intein-containing Rv2578c family radical SAM protein n=1 Tax=Gryllotalpicola reticulitermitis TaxID=1184153 RepID=A0ABV8Q4M2_9MICO
MRWERQELGIETDAALPGLAKLNNLVRTVKTPEFDGIVFHEILAKSALNQVPGASKVMPYAWTINPYRGCSHACAYCLDPETSILMADGRQLPLWMVKVGDEVMGTRKEGAYRRYTPSKVVAKWDTRKRAYRITLADGTAIVASGDHRFLTNRGWKYVTGSMSGTGRRPYLTPNNKLMGLGAGVAAAAPFIGGDEYRRGYLTGMVRGDGMMLRRAYSRGAGRGSFVASRFRLALADHEALDRSRFYLTTEGIDTVRRRFSVATDRRREINGIFTSRAEHYDAIKTLIDWPERRSDQWRAGFLYGIFDAEGSCSRGVLRVSNANEAVLQITADCMRELGFECVREGAQDNGVATIRLLGGLPARDRFFRTVEPAITRKLALAGQAVKSGADLRIVSIEDLGETVDMIDITTETGDFVANGVVSHNCFARPTHKYLELNVGHDFDSQIIVKVNVAEVLRRELAKPKWQANRHPVALGTNTDPYQRAEGRYKLMPGIIGALADARTPFSILTKGTLLRRDLPLLKEASTRVPVDVAMSIAIYDDELQQSVEPGTPRAKERLATVTAVRNAGLDCSVFMMPILPYLTDTTDHLDYALGLVKESGATSVLYTALHLKPGVKQWFTFWLEREHPELMDKYAKLYENRSYAPKEYRRWLAARIKPLIAKHGLVRGREDIVTGGIDSQALAAAAGGSVSGAGEPGDTSDGAPLQPRGRQSRVDANGERRTPRVVFEYAETDAASLSPGPTLF